MSYELTGKVLSVGAAEKKSDKLTIREMIVETSRNAGQRVFTETIPFQFKNAACDKLNGVKSGDTVKVKFDLGGREWNGRYFLSANAWAVDVEGGQQAPPASTVEDDLPF